MAQQEQEYRHIMCDNSKCGVKIKFPVSEKNYGRTGTVTCKKCGTVMGVTIPVPAKTTSGDRRDRTGPKSDREILETLIESLKLFDTDKP